MTKVATSREKVKFEFAVVELYLMSRLICKKDLVLFLFPHRTYVLDIC